MCAGKTLLKTCLHRKCRYHFGKTLCLVFWSHHHHLPLTVSKDTSPRQDAAVAQTVVFIVITKCEKTRLSLISLKELHQVINKVRANLRFFMWPQLKGIRCIVIGHFFLSFWMLPSAEFNTVSELINDLAIALCSSIWIWSSLNNIMFY